MADFGSGIKGIWMKGMEAIGNAASSIATNTKSKVDEMNLVNRRAEILKDFGNQAYALWQKGEHFPEELASQLQELEKLDERLNDLRAERLAGVKAQEAPEPEKKEPEEEAGEEEPAEEAEAAEEGEEIPEAEEESEEEAEEEAEEAEETDDEPADGEVPVIRVENPEPEAEPAEGLSDAIDSLFHKIPSAEETAEKLDSALDSLQEGLNQFSTKVDQHLEELSDAIEGNSEKPEE